MKLSKKIKLIIKQDLYDISYINALENYLPQIELLEEENKFLKKHNNEILNTLIDLMTKIQKYKKKTYAGSEGELNDLSNT